MIVEILKIILIVILIINFCIQVYYYMHMFQLSSYFNIKYLRWIRKNIKQILVNYIGLNILIKKKKIKTKVKFIKSNRVIRMFITESIITILLLILGKNYIIYVCLGLNIIAPFICMLANIINYPIEELGRRYYINDAKKILKQMPNLLVIGVTGSYGKTSIKNYLEKVLSKNYNVLVTPKNYNTTMGVVKTIREELKPVHQVFICEMGATKLGDIKEICDLVNPQIGIITAVGPQHLESFKSIENVLKTKMELADSVWKNKGMVFLNGENEYLKEHYKNVISKDKNLKKKSKLYTAKDIDKKYTINLLGKQNLINIAGVIDIAEYMKISQKDIVSQVKKIRNVEHRLELIERGNMNIIDDSYNSNPVSSKYAIDALCEFKGKNIIVTPGLIELGKEEEKYNREFAKYAAKKCDEIFLVKSRQSDYMYNELLKSNYSQNSVYKVENVKDAFTIIANNNLKQKVNVLIENDLPDNY